jgi:hypothetical protein
MMARMPPVSESARAGLHSLPRIFSLLILAGVLAGLYAYPYARPELGCGLMAVFILGVLRPWLLLFLIPVWLVLVNLAPWSGSLYLEDYDLLMGTSLASLLASHAYRLKGALSPLQWLAVSFLALSVVISFFRGFLPIPSWNPIELSTYYSHWNALCLAKGFFWALLLLPGITCLFHEYKERAQSSLTWGLAVAGGCAGIIAMWERGVFHVMSTTGSPYAILASLLDFTTPYRITALFSEMHTGGEAIDGFMALTWPFGFLALMSARSRTGFLLGGATLILALYAVVTTFSRASYVALASGLLAGAVMMLVYWRNRLVGKEGKLIPMLTTIIVPLALGYLQSRGGIISLGAALGAWAASLMAGYWFSSRYRSILIVPLGGLFVLAVYWIAHGMLGSKWVHNSPHFIWSIAASMAMLAIAGGFFAGKSLNGIVGVKVLVTLVVLMAGGVTVVAPALLGTRMAVRFSTDREDADTRITHWKHTLSIMNRDWATRLWGMGIGRFPENYLFAYSSRHGNYGFRKESDRTVLRLDGGEDLTFSQRVSLPAWQTYSLSLDARTPDKRADLRVRVCRRHILVPYDWNPECVSIMNKLTNTEGKWQHFDWTFAIGALGDGASFGRRPLVLELMNNEYRGDNRRATLIEISSVSIRDQQGREKIANGDFSLGLERWFPYFDFNHMPWHIKNLWVNLYFDQGWFGVCGFAAFLSALIFAAAGLARKHELWGVTAAVMSAAYMSVGIVGGLVDVPRVILIFYLTGMATMIVWKIRADQERIAFRAARSRNFNNLPKDGVRTNPDYEVHAVERGGES